MITVPYEIAVMINNYNIHPVKAWRVYMRMSQKILARKTGLSDEEVERIEVSNLHLHPNYLNKLSLAFNILPEVLTYRFRSA